MTLIEKIESLGYEIKEEKGSFIIVIVDGDRISALNEIADKTGGKYNPKGSGSSIGRVECSGKNIVVKNKSGGGSGAGSAATALAESAQCVYLAAAYTEDNYRDETLLKQERNIDISVSVNDVVEKLPEHWKKSCILTANYLKEFLPRNNYEFHRGSSWVSKLETHWKKLNKDEKAFSNLNKWSPADIYVLTAKGKSTDITSATSIKQLNNILLDGLNNGDIIGISLKQVKNEIRAEYKNCGSKHKEYSFVAIKPWSTDFFSSGDIYLEFNAGKIQFRRFGNSWQGEIKGKTANMGKIGGGPIHNVMKKYGVSLTKQSDIRSKLSSAQMKNFKSWYEFFAKTKTTEKQFSDMVEKKDYNWLVSKYLSIELGYYISKLSSAKKDSVVNDMLSYAASESELSGPYIKVS